MRVRLKFLIPGILAAAVVGTSLVIGFFRAVFETGAGWDILVGGVVCLGIAAGVGLWIGQSLAQPLEGLRRRLHRALSLEGGTEGGGEGLPEVEAAATLLEELESALQTFRASAEGSIHDAAVAARDLQRRFGEWASRLQAQGHLVAETAKSAGRLGVTQAELLRKFKFLDTTVRGATAAVEELSNLAAKAKGLEDARGLSQEAVNIAEEGTQVVKEVTEGMNRLDTS
ncbi:MAG: hypothetical protein ACYTHM_19100, partial [Planctomycetota bacterium]